MSDDKIIIIPPSKLTLAKPSAPIQREHPVAKFLSRYSNPTSRQAMMDSLRACAAVMAGVDTTDAPDPFATNWHSLNETSFNELKARLIAKFKLRSASRHMVAAKGVMRACWRLKLIDDDTWHDIEESASVKIDAGDASGRALSKAEIAALFKACGHATTFRGARRRAIVACCYYAGLRRSEVSKLPLIAFSSELAQLKVTGKGNKTRIVPLVGGAKSILDNWIVFRENLAPASYGDSLFKIGSSTVLSLLESVGKKAGLAHFSPHDLRRTFATHLIESGVDLELVRRLMGHSSIETTKRYDKRGATALVEAVKVLNDF